MKTHSISIKRLLMERNGVSGESNNMNCDINYLELFKRSLEPQMLKEPISISEKPNVSYHDTENLATLFFIKMFAIHPAITYMGVDYDTEKLNEYMGLNADSVLFYTLSPRDKSSTTLFQYKNCILQVSSHLGDDPKATVTVFCKPNMVPELPELVEFSKDKVFKPSIGILKKDTYGGLDVIKINFNLDTELGVERHYNDDFIAYHETLLEKLNEGKSGLYMLHGEPGTGKSEYIKHLTGLVSRHFLFIPAPMVGMLATPEFTDLLTDKYKGCVVVIEDAEKALMKRESEDGFHNSEIVSTLLNLTDGLYADVTNVSIIVTYNGDRANIDPALLRKGRLKVEYEFKKLSLTKSQDLAESLGLPEVSEELTLSDIYNMLDQMSSITKVEKTRIGF